MGMQQSRAHEESQISEPFYGCGETNAAKRQAAGRRLLAPNELYFLRVCLRAFASSRLLFQTVEKPGALFATKFDTLA